MSQPAIICAAAEPQFTRILRLVGLVTLAVCSAALTALTRPAIDLVTLATFLRLGLFVAALGMLGSSIAAFWWRDAALRRAEWAAYLGLGLLFAEQLATGTAGRPVHPAALIFALLVVAIVLARVTRRGSTDAACNCG